MPDHDLRPPAIPVHPLGVAALLDSAVRSVRRNLAVCATVALPVALVVAVATVSVQLATLGSSSAVLATFSGLLISSFAATVLSGVLAPVFAAELATQFGGARIGVGQLLRRVSRSGLPLLVLAVIVVVCEYVGLAFFIVGGLWLWGIWAVAAPALTLERTGIVRALSRSFGLVKDAFWRTWGVRALGWLLTYVLGLLISLPFSALAYGVAGTDPFDRQAVLHSSVLFTLIVGVGGLLARCVTMPITAAVDALIYTDLRMRREGMDLVLGLPPRHHPSAPVSAA